MTNITWPQTFPQVMRLEGLGAKKKTNVIRTQMDAGPQKTRRRYTVSTKEFTGSVVLTEAQREYLEDWYDNVLGSGVLRFVMKDPQTLQPAEFRFLEEYDEEASDGLWIITMKLEKMNA